MKSCVAFQRPNTNLEEATIMLDAVIMPDPRRSIAINLAAHHGPHIVWLVPPHLSLTFICFVLEIAGNVFVMSHSSVVVFAPFPAEHKGHPRL